MFAARTPEGVKVGELDEEFVYESRIGDRFLLGAFGWKIVGQDRDTVFVERSEAQGARLPFWKGEIRGRGLKTSLAFGKMMGQLGRAKEEERKGLLKRMGLDDAAAESGAELIRRQMKATKALPDDQTVIAEHFRDHTGRWQVMFHAPFGRRVLAPLCLLALIIGRPPAASAGKNFTVSSPSSMAASMSEGQEQPGITGIPFSVQ